MTIVTINLDLKELDRLRAKVDARTRADLVRRALALLDVAADHADHNAIVIGEGEKQVRVIL